MFELVGVLTCVLKLKVSLGLIGWLDLRFNNSRLFNFWLMNKEFVGTKLDDADAAMFV